MYPPNQPQQPEQWQGNQPPFTNYPPQGPIPGPQPTPEWQQWQQQPYQQQGMPPQYQPPQQPPKKKSKLPIIIGIVVVIVLFACIGSALATHGGNSNTGTTANTNTSNSSSSNTSSSTNNNNPAPTNQHFKVGQTVKVGDWQVTVDSAKTSTGSEFNKPQTAGDVFLEVVVTMKNLSSQEQDVSSIVQWSLQDSTGQKYTETIDTDAGATLDGKVEAGSLLKGSLAYEVPGTQKSFTLNFENDITSAGQTIWDINV